ncbi:MAG: type 1 glutamine amidotransferase domain-containing protein [Ilumatobacteraceae bacterium]
MSNELAQQRIAVLTANEGVEQIELTSPWAAIERAGGLPVHIAPKAGHVQGFDHLDKADVFDATIPSRDAHVEDYVGLVLPGGVANPDQLRTDEASVQLIRRFVEAGKPVAVICHGPWTLIEAAVVEGRTLTSWPSLRTDLENAGATWMDESVVVCSTGPNTIVSSRRPDDLPDFERELIAAFSGAAERQRGD